MSNAHRVFVETYFNLLQLGAGGADGSAGQGGGTPLTATPTPPAP